MKWRRSERTSWSLRRWIVTGMLVTAIIPLVVTLFMLLLVDSSRSVDAQEVVRAQQAELARAQVIEQIWSRPDEWGSAEFQRELISLLDRASTRVQLLSPTGQIIFAWPDYLRADDPDHCCPDAPGGPPRKTIGFPGSDISVVVDASGQVRGLVALNANGFPLYSRSLIPEELVPLALFLSVILSSVVSVYWVSSATLKPLAALQKATERIGSGDLDVTLPQARVREVQHLTQSFAAMRDGLREAIGRQAELEQQRRELVASVSHDLRTPLSSIRGYLEGLRDGVARTPEQTAHYIEVCLEKARVLERLVNDLFDFTRLEYLEQQPDKEPVNLAEAMAHWAESFQPAAAGRGITLMVEPGQPVQVHVDPLQLERVIANLLDNALRHTAAGGRVVVGWAVTAAQVEIWVADTGEGIDPADLPHIFTPLYRAEKSRSRQTGGAGLGLPIARRIARAHGGDLTARSIPGIGSRFTVTIPLPAQVTQTQC